MTIENGARKTPRPCTGRKDVIGRGKINSDQHVVVAVHSVRPLEGKQAIRLIRPSHRNEGPLILVATGCFEGWERAAQENQIPVKTQNAGKLLSPAPVEGFLVIEIPIRQLLLPHP